MRRNRRTAWSRRLVAENRLSVDDLIWPVFVHDGKAKRAAIPSMPGVERLSIDLLAQAAGEACELGIPAIAIFPATDPAKKTPDGDEALNAENLVCRGVRAIKEACPEIGVMCDVALDPYTDPRPRRSVAGRPDRQRRDGRGAGKQALMQAQAGCDIIAPSDMMDGRVGAIRGALEDGGLRARADPGLRRQVCVGLLRPVPRRDRLSDESGSARRQEDLPDGSGQQRRGAARGGARHRRRAPTW